MASLMAELSEQTARTFPETRRTSPAMILLA